MVRQKKASTAPRRIGSRLDPKARRLQILDEASEFFAEHGFEASTPDLAERLNISQSLLYRYFSDKDALLRAVYRHVFPPHDFWLGWERLLADPAQPLRVRLVRFFKEYADVTWNYRVTRLLLWAGLTKPPLSKPYTAPLRQRIFPAIIRAIRADCGQSKSLPLSDVEMELVQSLHGTMYHLLAIRRWIHNRRFKGDVDEIIELKVDLFLQGARQTFRQMGDASPSLSLDTARLALTH